MIFVGPATRDEVNLHWLRSEWSKLQLPEEARYLIDSANLNDSVQNGERARILSASRHFILDYIPGDARYRYVRVEEDDLPGLFILTCWDWFLDTGRMFALTNTLTHLQHGRGGDIGGRRVPIDHLRTVGEKIPYIRNYEADAPYEYLILVATKETGPYTIIDGTHRAAALLVEHQEKPTTPWNAILIDSMNMTANRWHVGFADAPQIVSGLNALADDGDIW